MSVTKRIYSNQKLSSRQRKHPMPNYTRDELRNWIKLQFNFEALWRDWIDSKYLKTKRISCDRINEDLGYSLDNIKLVTWEENLKRQTSQRLAGKGTQSRKINQLSLEEDLIETFLSINSAKRSTKIRGIDLVLAGKNKTAGGFKWKYN